MGRSNHSKYNFSSVGNRLQCYIPVCSSVGSGELFTCRLQYQKRLLRLTAEANGGYYANLSAEHSLPGLNLAKSASQALLANIDYLSDSYGMVGIRLQGDYPIMKQYNLSLSVQWQAAYCKKMERPGLSLVHWASFSNK